MAWVLLFVVAANSKVSVVGQKATCFFLFYCACSEHLFFVLFLLCMEHLFFIVFVFCFILLVHFASNVFLFLLEHLYIGFGIGIGIGMGIALC